ncbi:MAG TPA: IS1182 family transposase [Gammaproteobacteria bacterium]|nr:IS1182 family transposase [Gammaproteobacteria bacterium]
MLTANPTTQSLVDDSPSSAAAPKPQPRLRCADRQTLLPAMLLEDLLAPEHLARTVWQFVQGLDLTPLLESIRSVEGRPGRPALDPKLLVALWLYATIEGIGSARAVAWLCANHHGFRWLCGGVEVNYHTLADFRVAHLDFLDELLTHSVATLMEQDLVDLNRVAQDGLRVRASAGAASFRRRPTLERCLEEARAQVQRLRDEVANDPGEAARQQQKARERAAREREERIHKAMEAKKKADNKEKARVSTTDPEATVMKMADGGFRPAYNVQFSTDTNAQIIVGVEVATCGSDQGQMVPMVEQIYERYEQYPQDVLVDGGFVKHDDIDTVSAPEQGCTVYAPVPKPKEASKDRYAPRAMDSAAVAAWRQRMASAEAHAIYKDRAATAECVNALARNRGLRQLLVRGIAKVKAIALWYAIAHNLLRAVSLRAALATHA